jgi:ABC-type phosphate/phosphonate transport system ATPase subunit
MKLELKKFDIRKIKDDSVVVMIGKRNTGKSFLVRDLLHCHSDMPIGTVISATECSNHFFKEMIPSIFIHDEFTPELIGSSVFSKPHI